MTSSPPRSTGWARSSSPAAERPFPTCADRSPAARRRSAHDKRAKAGFRAASRPGAFAKVCTAMPNCTASTSPTGAVTDNAAITASCGGMIGAAAHNTPGPDSSRS
ncbi:hypothetical protein GCM10023215_67030 [Pseudonocardia yuanmonensis]|uniref:Uncharacterized protein n=1 Tax=Pseudonocardia yuanmonensis TaxID=1095914 RepID=A0ABP8XSU0_9PSEU